MHHFNVPNNADAYATEGANTGEGGLTINVSGVVGATVLTSTDTSIVAGFGNTPWPCAIEHTDGTHSFNLVLGDNGSNTITLLNPIKKAAYKLSPKYDAVQGQHLTKRATRAWAEYVYAQREVDCVADKFLDGAWASQPPKYQTLFKNNSAVTAYGAITSAGVTAGLSVEYGGLTPSDAEGYLIRPLPNAAGIFAGLHQVGHGVEMTQQVSGLSGVLESFVGEQKAASGNNGVTITVTGIKNGVESVLYTKSTVRYCVRVVVPFVGFDQIKMTVVANSVGARYIRVTETRVWIGDYANRPIIDKNGNYLAMGDSWFAYYGGEFGKHLQQCMRNDGGVGTVVTKAKGGTTAKHALDWFDSRVQGMQLTGILMHYYTNDINSALGLGSFIYPNPQGGTTNYAIASLDEYYALISTLVTRAKSIGVTPIVFRAGGTASSAQSQHQQNAGRAVAQGVWSNPDRQSLPDELADSTAFINNYGKSRGSRTLLGGSPVYALDNSPSSFWANGLGKRIGSLESIVYDFSVAAVGDYAIGTDTDSDGLSNGVAQTTFGVTTGITASNSIVDGKQKLSVSFNNPTSGGGFRQRYQYTSIAGHRYVMIMVLEGCTPSKPFELAYTLPAGTTLATTPLTDAAGNAVAGAAVTQTASAVQYVYVSLTNPLAVATLDTVVKSLYVIDVTAFDSTYGTTFATLPDADVIAIMRGQLLRDLPTSVRLRDTATGVTRRISVNNGSVVVV